MAKPGFFQRLLEALGLRPEPPAPAPPPPPPQPPRQPSAPRIDLHDERIPESSRDRVALIMSLVGDLEERAARRGLATERKELERISSVHLPRLKALEPGLDIGSTVPALEAAA